MKPSEEKLITEDQITKRIVEMAEEINRDQGDKELVIISILKGSVIFFADLIRKLTCPVKCEFIRVEMEENEVRESIRKITYDVDFEVVGKDIMIIEDVLDTGITLNYLIDYFRGKHAESIKTCVLLDKTESRKVDIHIDYSGFEIPNKFVVGYGLDHNERYRELPYITTIDGVTWPLAEKKE